MFDPNHKAQAFCGTIEDMATNSKSYLRGSYLHLLFLQLIDTDLPNTVSLMPHPKQHFSLLSNGHSWLHTLEPASKISARVRRKLLEYFASVIVGFISRTE